MTREEIYAQNRRAMTPEQMKWLPKLKEWEKANGVTDGKKKIDPESLRLFSTQFESKAAEGYGVYERSRITPEMIAEWQNKINPPKTEEQKMEIEKWKKMIEGETVERKQSERELAARLELWMLDA